MCRTFLLSSFIMCTTSLLSSHTVSPCSQWLWLFFLNFLWSLQRLAFISSSWRMRLFSSLMTSRPTDHTSTMSDSLLRPHSIQMKEEQLTIAAAFTIQRTECWKKMKKSSTVNEAVKNSCWLWNAHAHSLSQRLCNCKLHNRAFSVLLYFWEFRLIQEIFLFLRPCCHSDS